MSTIALEQMEFYAYHGCFDEERIIGTWFLVDLYLETDTTEAEQSDNLETTVNYQEVYLLVRAEMAIKSSIIEHVAHRILKKIKEKYPMVSNARIKLRKMNPPLGGKLESVSVTMEL
ncbi:MAG: dihydroneopterin aldolase [Bacteroidota bacterium]|nr:dihydroneopterin aldolase [Bacteroidota bacterium]